MLITTKYIDYSLQEKSKNQGNGEALECEWDQTKLTPQLHPLRQGSST